MASLQGWGRQTWNSGAWNSFAPAEASGNGLTSSVGTVSLVTTNVFGVTGIALTTTIGDESQESVYSFSGNALTTSLGTMPNPTIVDNQLLTGWNRGVGTTLPLGWSTSSWGNGDFILTVDNGLSGASLSVSLGTETVAANADVTTTGIGLTSSSGTTVATGVAEVTPSGNAIAATLGTETVTGSSAVTASGIALSAVIGDEDATAVPQSGWNRGANQVTAELIGWSDNLWGTLETEYSVTGNTLSENVGQISFVGDVNVVPTGQQATASASTPGTSIFVTGVTATPAIGTFAISGDSQLTIVAASEPQLDISLGTLPTTIDVSPLVITPNTNDVSVVGTASVDATGNSTTSSLGTETVTGSAPVTIETADFLTIETNTPGFVGSVNISVSGNAISAGLGEESQETLYSIPGDSATATLGTLVASGSSALTLVGNSATSGTGTLQGTFWSEVDDSNSDISWTEVHKAA